MAYSTFHAIIAMAIGDRGGALGMLSDTLGDGGAILRFPLHRRAIVHNEKRWRLVYSRETASIHRSKP